MARRSPRRRRVRGQNPRHRWWNRVVWRIPLLLIPAGLFVRSLQAAHTIDPGFDAEKLVSAPLDINLLRYSTEQGREPYKTIVERAKHRPLGGDALLRNQA